MKPDILHRKMCMKTSLRKNILYITNQILGSLLRLDRELTMDYVKNELHQLQTFTISLE